MKSICTHTKGRMIFPTQWIAGGRWESAIKTRDKHKVKWIHQEKLFLSSAPVDRRFFHIIETIKLEKLWVRWAAEKKQHKLVVIPKSHSPSSLFSLTKVEDKRSKWWRVQIFVHLSPLKFGSSPRLTHSQVVLSLDWTVFHFHLKLKLDQQLRRNAAAAAEGRA